MKRSTRMLLMSGNRGSRGYDDGRRNYGRSDYDWGSYAPEDRFRDRRGREHYDSGRFAPQNDGDMRVDGRYWDDREAYRPVESRYPMTTPYVPPVYQDYYQDYSQDVEVRPRPMNRIGFRVSGEMDRIPPEFGRKYRADAGHHDMDEMAYRRGGERMEGHGAGSGDLPFTRELAEKWVHSMKNADGTTGPHWTMEKTEEVRAQRGINCDGLAFWVAINMVYSDYAKVAEKVDANSMDFYAYMAKAFLEDKDSRNQGGEKLVRYYQYVVN